MNQSTVFQAVYDELARVRTITLTGTVSAD
jgi:hypothetical protein